MKGLQQTPRRREPQATRSRPKASRHRQEVDGKDCFGTCLLFVRVAEVAFACPLHSISLRFPRVCHLDVFMRDLRPLVNGPPTNFKAASADFLGAHVHSDKPDSTPHVQQSPVPDSYPPKPKQSFYSFT